MPIGDISVLKQLFDNVVIPDVVHDEFCYVKILCNRVNKLIDEGFVVVEDIDTDSQCYELYIKLCYGYNIDRPIGKGEAAAIVLAIKYSGILASNNADDIKEAIRKFGLRRIKTGDILVKAYNENIINNAEGEQIWKRMIDANRYLTKNTFSQYLNENPTSLL